MKVSVFIHHPDTAVVRRALEMAFSESFREGVNALIEMSEQHGDCEAKASLTADQGAGAHITLIADSEADE